MDAERHAMLARRLIEACGGLEPAAAECRLKKSHLSRFCDPEPGYFMPIDVVADLEAVAGAPIYSLAVAQLRAGSATAEDLVTEAAETTEEAADLQREVRRAANAGPISPAERRRLRRKVQTVREQLAELDIAIDGEGRS